MIGEEVQILTLSLFIRYFTKSGYGEAPQGRPNSSHGRKPVEEASIQTLFSTPEGSPKI